MGKFLLGQLVTTQGVFTKMRTALDFRRFVASSIARHLHGDWGNVSKSDKAYNDKAVSGKGRLLSAYIYLKPGAVPVTVWIITEANRSKTTILLPSEY